MPCTARTAWAEGHPADARLSRVWSIDRRGPHHRLRRGLPAAASSRVPGAPCGVAGPADAGGAGHGARCARPAGGDHGSVAVLAVAARGHRWRRDLSRAFGADWSQVDWPSVATMLLVVALIATVLVPLAWFTLPRRVEGVGTVFAAVASSRHWDSSPRVSPTAKAPPATSRPRSATSPRDSTTCRPSSARRSRGTTSLCRSSADAMPRLWQQAIGYEVAGINGILLRGSSTPSRLSSGGSEPGPGDRWTGAMSGRRSTRATSAGSSTPWPGSPARSSAPSSPRSTPAPGAGSRASIRARKARHVSVWRSWPPA